MTDSDSSDAADAQQNSALDTALDATDPISFQTDFKKCAVKIVKV